LCAAFDKGGDTYKEVKGIGFKDEENNIVINPPAPLIKNLDDLPMVDRTMLPQNIDYFNPIVKRMPFTTMFTTRGCTAKCTYCTSPFFYGEKVRFRSAVRVVDEMEESQKRLMYSRVDLQGGEGTLNGWMGNLDENVQPEIVILSAVDPRISIYKMDDANRVLFLDSVDLALQSIPINQFPASDLRLMTAGHFKEKDHVLIVFADSKNLRFYALEQGTLNQVQTVPVEHQPLKILSQDLNNDGLDELIVVFTQPNLVEILTYKNGRFLTLHQTNLDEYLFGNRVLSVANSDLNRDGYQDIIFAVFDGSLVILFGGETIASMRISPNLPLVVTGITAADFDRNGIPEIVLTGLDIESESPVFAMLCGDVTLGFEQSESIFLDRTFSLSQRFVIRSQDINLDGKPDIVLLDHDTKEVVIYLNQTLEYTK